MINVNTGNNNIRVGVSSSNTVNEVQASNSRAQYYSDLAQQSADAAAESAENAHDSELAAAQSATDASNSADDAEGSATNAYNSAVDAQTAEDNAAIWAEGSDVQVDVLGGTHSAKGWAQFVIENETGINTVADNISNVNAVANDLTNIDAVVDNETNINIVADGITDVNAVAVNISDVSAVADNETNINAVNLNRTNINAVSGGLININAVALDLSNINNVANDLPNIDNVALSLSNINAVVNDLTNINAVAADLTNIDAASSYAALSKQYAVGEPTEPAEGSAKYWAGQAAQGQVQADWAETDSTKKNFIKNKPTIPTDTGDLTNNAGYIKSSALNGYATETWVGNQGFLTSVPTATANNLGVVKPDGTTITINANGVISGASQGANKDLSNLSTTGEAKFQAPLVSGTNIKTINNTSLLGTGNISVPTAVLKETITFYAWKKTWNSTFVYTQATTGENIPVYSIINDSFVLISQTNYFYNGKLFYEDEYEGEGNEYDASRSSTDDIVRKIVTLQDENGDDLYPEMMWG